MYCNRCGAEVTPGAAFCSECGAPMVQEGGLQQNQTEQAAPFPMKWHKALIYCFLFLGAALSAINAIMVFSGSHYQGYADMVYGLMPKLKTADTIMGILCLGGIAVALITRQKLAGFKRGAPQLGHPGVCLQWGAGSVLSHCSQCGGGYPRASGGILQPQHHLQFCGNHRCRGVQPDLLQQAGVSLRQLKTTPGRPGLPGIVFIP